MSESYFILYFTVPNFIFLFFYIRHINDSAVFFCIVLNYKEDDRPFSRVLQEVSEERIVFFELFFVRTHLRPSVVVKIQLWVCQVLCTTQMRHLLHQREQFTLNGCRKFEKGPEFLTRYRVKKTTHFVRPLTYITLSVLTDGVGNQRFKSSLFIRGRFRLWILFKVTFPFS